MVCQAYQELLTSLEDLSALARRECSDYMLRVVLSSSFNLLMAQITLCILASDKRQQWYLGLVEQHGTDPAANSLFSRFTDQISHHFKSVLTLMPMVDDLQHSGPAAAGGAQQQCAQ